MQTKKKTMTFIMVDLKSNSTSIEQDFVEPLLDDGAPYSGMGIEELKLIQNVVIPEWDGKLETLPNSIADKEFWQRIWQPL